ncbi:ClpP family protease [Prauserella rugosa]|uniref:ATP-dependent Clp protease proteolytic subunit n=1 Tax=Prauserella rugosa TaxID=43354 RepID=A0A660CB54_9PSEU|nr:ATP-dependent Clp protease proteolytic subunit [Prauserella rugosa]KID31318.1 protease subunit of ATP-dependent protease [Prauserella sp. Am3]KMS89790.1 Clp protease ClpP [Streptomyces regensis]TWH19127.1 ATP-dependent Clp protease protease subunit [Prauserella rugosa]
MTTSETTPPDGSPDGRSTLQDTLSARLLDERVIVLGQEVDDAVANRLSGQLLLLAADDPGRDIALYINSPGGSVTAGLSVLDTMRLIDCDVVTVGMGLAASMGQLLLTAGAPGKRYVLPHCAVLMHQPSSGVGGTASDIARSAETLRRSKQEIAELIAERAGQPVERIIADSDRDRWFDAEEACDYGLADHVVRGAAPVV